MPHDCHPAALDAPTTWGNPMCAPQAKYDREVDAETGKLKKMSREQYGALRRKIGGACLPTPTLGASATHTHPSPFSVTARPRTPTRRPPPPTSGTYKDFMKEYVEEERVEATWYKPNASGGTVPYLPLLVGVVLAMLATTVVVVSQTS